MTATTAPLATILIGYTESDLPRYSSFDGFEPGAAQRVTPVSVDGRLIERLTPEDVAEFVFLATNAPESEVEGSPLAKAVRAVLTGYVEADTYRVRSLSVGDTVTVHNAVIAVERVGVRRVV